MQSRILTDDAALARTVAIARCAAERLDQPALCAAYLQAALAGPERVRLGAAVALLVRGGTPAVMATARSHLTGAVQRVALVEAEAEHDQVPTRDRVTA